MKQSSDITVNHCYVSSWFKNLQHLQFPCIYMFRFQIVSSKSFVVKGWPNIISISFTKRVSSCWQSTLNKWLVVSLSAPQLEFKQFQENVLLLPIVCQFLLTVQIEEGEIFKCL